MKNNHFLHFIVFIILVVNLTYPQQRIEGYIKGISFDICDDAEEIKTKISEVNYAETRYVVSQFKMNLDSIIHKKNIASIVPLDLLTLIEAGVPINETHVLKLLENKNGFIVFRDNPYSFYSYAGSFKHNGKIIGETVFWTSKEERIYTGTIGFQFGIVYKNEILQITLRLRENNFEICKSFPDYFIKKDQVYYWKDDSNHFFAGFIKEIRSNKEKLPDTIAGFFACCDLIVKSIKFE